MNIVKS